MPDLEVNVFNQKLKLSYQENEKQRLIKAIEILNNNWNKFSHLHGKVSDIKIVTLISLELQDSIGDIKAIKDDFHKNQSNNESLKKEIESKNNELEKSIETIKKLQVELDYRNHELTKLEYILDELNNELLNIKKNILKKNHE